MFLPIADTPNPPGRPYVTWGLIAINVAIYLLISLPASFSRVELNDPALIEYLRVLGVRGQVTAQEVHQNINAYNLLVFKYGFRPADFSLISLFSSFFLHGGFMHLAGNMLFLFIFGDNVEYRLGRLRYILTYLACGVTATLFFALFARGSQTPLIGASGAIFGILGCYFLWFPRNRVRCFIFFFPFIMTSIYVSARLILGFYLVIDNLLPFIVTGSSGSGIAHGAHIGGFFGGLGIAWGVDRYYLLFNRKTVTSEPSEKVFGSLKEVCPSLKNGDFSGASACYLGLQSRDERLQVPNSDVIAIGDFLLSEKRFRDSLSVFRRFIADRPSGEGVDKAYLGAGKAMLNLPRQMTSAYHYFLSAYDLACSEDLAVEAQTHLRLIEKKRQLSGEQ